MNTQYSVIIFVVLIAGLVIWRRTASMRRPIRGNGLRMLVPIAILLLLGTQIFGTGQYKGSALETVGAIVIGLLFSIPLIMTTNYEVRTDGLIYAKQSKGFIIALVGLLVVRLALRSYITNVDPMTVSLLFYIVAMSYLTVWRVVSFVKFRKVYLDRQAGMINVNGSGR
jgi:membrane protein CcdC involved in cytochrome C biogenesis